MVTKTPKHTPVMNGHIHSPSNTLTILGCGALGTAILSGLLTPSTSASPQASSHSNLLPTHFLACVRRSSTAETISQTLKPHISNGTLEVLLNDNVRAVRQSSTVLISVQPHALASLLSEPGMREALAKKLIISVLAGVTTSQILSLLNPSLTQSPPSSAYSVIRTMPNTACFVRQSITVIETPSETVSRESVELTEGIFNCVGRVVYTDSAKFDVCTALCGSTPAFFAVVAEAMVDGGVMLGVGHKEGLEMVAQAMKGTAEMILEGRTPGRIRYEVASPGGSTIRGLMELEEGRTRAVFGRAIKGAVEGNGRLRQGVDEVL